MKHFFTILIFLFSILAAPESQAVPIFSISNSHTIMKVKYSALMSAASGKLNGSVASKNRSGAYLRNKVTPVNPQTAAQNAVRSRLASFSQAWRGLTAAQRAAWDGAVNQFQKTNVFGDLVSPTGKNLYTRLNSNLDNIGESAISSPPLPAEVPEPIAGALTYDVGTGDAATFAFTNDSSAVTYALFATAPLSPGIGFFKNRYRQIGIYAGSGGSPIDFKADYIAKFGAPAEGQKIAVKLVPIVVATGQRGVGATASTLVVST